MALIKTSGRWLAAELDRLSITGLLWGVLFFAAALTPSMVPRSSLVQGGVAGGCLAIGYGLGFLLAQAWLFLGLPNAQDRPRITLRWIIFVLSAAILLWALWNAPGWQDDVRAVMGLKPLESWSYAFEVLAVALFVLLLLLTLARLIGRLILAASARVSRFAPQRFAVLVSIIIVALVLWSLVNDLAVRAAFRFLDSSFREFDALMEPNRPQPSSPLKTGSVESLVHWDQLGRAGREYVADAPTATRITEETGFAAKEPIRVYVGLGGGDTAEARARLALEELKRQGGFDRPVLVVITPTGTGWVDPAAADSLEYLLHGDVASVAVQYSYLNSPLSLLAQPEYGAEQSRALFLEIYRYWAALPKDQRPRLYLHGLSLGALNSQNSADLFEMIEDPISGALWSGPPFASRLWRSVTNARNPGTPEWRPEFRDGRIVRFSTQDGSPVPSDAPWGPMRVVYLQYASDPIVFFAFSDLYRRPAWMNAPRGRDVSPSLRWYPIVTMLQLAVDMGIATATPMGYGHVYAPEHYIDAWVSVLGVNDWPPDRLAKLKHDLGEAMRAETEDDRGG
ncbi:alpha/beta hydrolase [Aestuariivirga sp.]|uniref:alpha/beta hydrolase n=1 Tax=Aestuariivirga sp. TaxID=2650926 RepID=UPI0039E2C3FD